jgi:hypothetical protein
VSFFIRLFMSFSEDTSLTKLIGAQGARLLRDQRDR